MSISLKRPGSEIDLYEEKPDITSDSGSEGYIPLKIKSNNNKNKKARSVSSSANKGKDGEDDQDKGIKVRHPYLTPHRLSAP